QVESAIRATGNVWVAYSFLFCQFRSNKNWLSLIYIGKSISISTYSHIGRLILIFKIYKQVPGKVFLVEFFGFYAFLQFWHNFNTWSLLQLYPNGSNLSIQ